MVKGSNAKRNPSTTAGMVSIGNNNVGVDASFQASDFEIQNLQDQADRLNTAISDAEDVLGRADRLSDDPVVDNAMSRLEANLSSSNDELNGTITTLQNGGAPGDMGSMMFNLSTESARLERSISDLEDAITFSENNR